VDGLIVDADVLAGAPAHLNRAGVGDLLSMFTAPADWLLADAIGLPVRYHQVPVDLVRPHGERLLSLAPRLAAADPAALAELAELLTLSGISMGVAGGTAVSSGLEHLISHLLDMHCAAHGLVPDSHGAQVGIGSLVATSTWARVRAALRAGTAGRVELPDPDRARQRIEDAFARLDPTGATAAECWAAYATKLRRLQEVRPRLQLVLATWSEVDARLDSVLVDPIVLATTLDTLGAPVRFGDLGPRYDPEVARWAITNAHLMRDRFTVADLSDLLGLGGPQGTEAILSDLDTLVVAR
jgi:glycerol-1-phosphate dehydrogenase [NAD(P)+]